MSQGILGHGAIRQLLVVVAFIFVLSFFFAVYTHVDFIRPLHIRQPDIYVMPPSDTDDSSKQGFLVYSPNCQIPDVDPYHSTVRHLISEKRTIDCSRDYPGVTWTKGNVLYIRPELIPNTGRRVKLQCCYFTITRTTSGKSDESDEISTNCKRIKHGTTVNDEFIKIECKIKGNNTVVYTNYHSFVHDKPLVESRCEKIPKAKLANSYSILIIGADAMSRLNMHRQFKKTYKYLTEEMGALEMYGFNKVGDNTLPNLVPLLIGIKEEELPYVCWNKSKPFDNCPFIWNKFSKLGYRTLYAEDTPAISSFNYIKEGFFKQPTDYYFRPFMRILEKNLGRDKKLNCYTCVGSVSEVEATLSWVEKFASRFAKRPYFAFTWTNSMTHDYLNSGSAADVIYESFFKNLHQRGDLNKTIVMFMGDHGLRWGPIRETFIGRMEERLPMLLVSFPKKFRQKFRPAFEAFRVNSNRLITQFDLYATLQNLLKFDGRAYLVDPKGIPQRLVSNFTQRALSLFEPVPDDRSCEDAHIDEHWCTCQKSTPISVDDAEAKHVAIFVVESLNKELEPYQRVCSPLVLRTIKTAQERAPGDNLRAMKDYDIFDYTVTITTEPNGAIYESTVRYVPHKHTHELLGEVSRLNLYGNQSHCIIDRKLKKYCYCKDMLQVS